ncbi:MAG TPA: 16S rRNA (cytosine(1402)-N(4))-methyltransferase RsmH [Actinomycetota bacterium]|nr:16S rRNA (cytosine(1402)-N(4))-methyltransferase RsmH [Actinomycetota bacterium]
MADEAHVPVLTEEIVELMRGADTVIDMTVGAGGHAEALLEAGVGRVVGVDRDPEALGLAAERLARFGDRFVPVRARFSEVPRIAEEASIRAVEGTLFDLGVSSLHLDRPDRGFSYRTEGPLDMRMGPEGLSAADLVNRLPEEELARIIFEHGEERASRRIARAIGRAREREPIETTAQLARIVAAAAPGRRRGPHPARRTFQALRIAVNEEVEELTASLPQAVGLLASDGRIAAVSYHSIEDRIVKRAFLGDERLDVLTKKPVRPSEREMRRNRRARSAKLRVARRVA